VVSMDTFRKTAVFHHMCPAVSSRMQMGALKFFVDLTV
jgi:hypothetical protein